jgi:hypothetical protein
MPRASLNIYKISRKDKGDYDESMAAVVIAATPGDAREMGALVEGTQPASVWYLPTTEVELLGKARSDAKGGVVVSEAY